MIGTLVGIVAITLMSAPLGWHRRWIADDGNGPVFNAFERAEANTTSTLRTCVLVAVTGASPTEPMFTATKLPMIGADGPRLQLVEIEPE